MDISLDLGADWLMMSALFTVPRDSVVGPVEGLMDASLSRERTGQASGLAARRKKRPITFKQSVFLAPSYSAVTLYDALGEQIGTVDPITRVRTLVERLKAVPREDPIPCGLSLHPDIAGPIKKLQRRYWESLALAAFGISVT